MENLGPLHRLLLASALSTALCAQSSERHGAVAAVADAYSTESGGYLCRIPGVADDLVLFADGDLVLRANGTARLGAFLLRASAIDRLFYVELEFSGKVSPGDVNHPPAGSPTLTLAAAAYAPAGPVDPATFVYYTTVTGTFTGLFAYGGERYSASNLAPAQLGLGASNKNVLLGLAVDLTLLPVAGVTVPTGPAELRADLLDTLPVCLSHVDDLPPWSGSSTRRGVDLPGVADDFVFCPAGRFEEHADGTATATATLRRQADYDDGWHLSLTLSAPVEPGAPNHPPAGHPITQLLPTAYVGGGGPIDPAAYRYYQQGSGTLIGIGANAGGQIQLTLTGAAQLGLGAAQGNPYFGIAADFAATVLQQPAAGALTIAGDLHLDADLATLCILPAPQVTAMSTTSLPNVTEQTLTLTGAELGFAEVVALGPILLADLPRRWFEGNMHVVDHDTIVVSIPQGLPAASYPLSVLNRSRMSVPVLLDLVAPTTVTLRTEADRLPGEAQHWISHQGAVQGFAFCLLLLSFSDLPSSAPGLVDLDIGNQFTDLILFDVVLHDPATGVAVVTLPAIPPTLQGHRLFAQTAVMDQSFFPLHPSDARFTDYLP
ncbi:MAG: hypothetical protein JNN13_05255 [Planctomycetes bacterium]|nr:hypothetical protein [Planctomycetota bacterium]